MPKAIKLIIFNNNNNNNMIGNNEFFVNVETEKIKNIFNPSLIFVVKT